MAHKFSDDNLEETYTGINIIRKMAAADLPDVLDIEKQSYSFPWTQKILTDCLHAGYSCHVAERDGEIMAYAILSVGAGESHILNLCVSPAMRRQGIARSLLGYLISQARQLGAETIYLEVRPSNIAAIELYESMGFNEIHVRPDYYPAGDGREDALVLGRDLSYTA